MKPNIGHQLKQLLKDNGCYTYSDFLIEHPPLIIYCDNKLVIRISANPVFHERTKHVEIDCHVVTDKLQAEIVLLLPFSSKEQVANMLTKPLHHGPFNLLQNKLGTINIYFSLKGMLIMKIRRQNSLLVQQTMKFLLWTRSSSINHKFSL